MRVVDKEVVERYVRKGASRCLFCGSSDVAGGMVEIDEEGAMQSMGCNECGAEWMDLYRLSGVMVMDECIHVDLRGKKG